jgi:hypothetical protein
MEENKFYKRKILELLQTRYGKEIRDFKLIKLSLNHISEIIPINNFKIIDEQIINEENSIFISSNFLDEFIFFKSGKKPILIEKKRNCPEYIYISIKDLNLELIIMSNGNQYYALI